MQEQEQEQQDMGPATDDADSASLAAQEQTEPSGLFADEHEAAAVNTCVPTDASTAEAETSCLAGLQHQPSSSEEASASAQTDEPVCTGAPLKTLAAAESANTGVEREQVPGDTATSVSSALVEGAAAVQEEGRPATGYFQEGLRVSHTSCLVWAGRMVYLATQMMADA